MQAYIVAAVAIILCYVVWKRSTRRRMPPGPLGLPILGYLPFLSSKPYLDFQRLAEKYGNIFSIRLGGYYTVVLNDFKSTKEAFAADAFMGRPVVSPFPANPETIETQAFIGMPWKGQRQFTLRMLKDLGFGKSKMEEHIQEEILELLRHFEDEAGKPFDVRRYLPSSMSNNIASLVFGKRLPYDDPDRVMMDETVMEIGRTAVQVGWVTFFPWLTGILKYLSKVKKLAEANNNLRTFIANEIQNHSKTLNPHNVRDYIDGYLLEIPKKKDEPGFSKPVLQDMVVAFFAAGSETVRVSVEWLMFTMASYQDVQRRVHAEIDEVLGSNRLPTWMDSKNMPYTEAVISEVMRWKTIVPINILRYTIMDSELDGYFIPKDSYVISNFWAIHHNQEFWGKDSEEFRPERFLSKDGKSVIKREQFIPFSIGKRSCPGEILARIEVFLYFVSIMQRFHIDPPRGKTVDLEGTLGISLLPKSQDLILTKR